MIVALLAAAAAIRPSPVLPPESARRQLQDARAIVHRTAPQLWQGFAATPFRVDLIDASREWLFCRRTAAPGFGGMIRDPATGCEVQSRPRRLSDDLEAALDIEGIGPAIAIHLPDTSDAWATTAWRLTILHESFHLYQQSLPGYREATRQTRTALGATDDNWPLDYPFPYRDAKVVAAFAAMGRTARAFLDASTAAASQNALVAYVGARRRAATECGERNWRYYEFQAGQEGVARWTEITLGERSGEASLVTVAEDRRRGWTTSLDAIDRQGLGSWKRSALYVFGAIEAQMLERWRPGWRQAYRRAPFALGAQLDAAVHAVR